MASKRLPVTIQLSQTKDADLIGKINNMPRGTRNGDLKEKLAIGFGSNPNEALVREIAELRKEVEQLRGIVAVLPAQIREMLGNITVAALPVDVPEPESPRISDDEIKKREANLRKREW